MDSKELLKSINKKCRNTLMETLNIEFVEINDNEVVATMPVNSKVHQPMGLLHGGATVALAESVGSVASLLSIDADKFEVRGIEISANHLKGKKEGVVRGIAKNIHKGKTTHLWEIRIVDEQNELISLCKLTNIVLPKRK
ncbi:MAG: PaaI family thioesterase [Lutimonas sp.]|jgi:1,4-dihydroxy-2-naphthoyl-CoA hydrolase